MADERPGSADDESTSGLPREGRRLKACSQSRQRKKACLHRGDGQERAQTIKMALRPRNKEVQDVDSTERNVPPVKGRCDLQENLSAFDPSLSSGMSSISSTSSFASPSLSKPFDNTLSTSIANMPESKASTNPTKRPQRLVTSKDTKNTKDTKDTKDTTSSEAGVEKKPSTTSPYDTRPLFRVPPRTPRPETDTTTPTTTKKRSATAASQANIPPLPKDTLAASLVMGCHNVYARQLQKRLDEFEAKFTAILDEGEPQPAMWEARKEALKAHEEVQNTVKDWVARWVSGQ